MSSAEGVPLTAPGAVPYRLNPQVHRLFNPFPPDPPTPFYGDGVDKVTHIMAQPERDDRGVHTGLEELHGAGVAQNVRRDPFVVQRGAVPLSDDAVPAYQALDGVGAERLPLWLGKSRSVGPPWRSRSQTWSTATVWAVSGVQRSLRSLPWHLTCAPGPNCTSWQVSWVSSERRRPVRLRALVPRRDGTTVDPA